MIRIFNEVISGFRLLFPRGKFRLLLIALSAIAAGISVSELLVMKFFSKLILEEAQVERSTFTLLVIGFLIFFIVTRVGQFFQRNYRVRAFEKSFKAANRQRTKREENAEWTMAFELTNILGNAVQLIAIIAFFALISPFVAFINLLIIFGILHVIGRIFVQQLEKQRQMLHLKGEEAPRARHHHATRVRAGESGALASGTGMLVLLCVLLFFSLDGQISISNTLVIFLGARLQNSVLSNTSRSLAKYARSQVLVVGDSNDD
jgi:sterol desaturase/sphingolipid hydroxylase (fatty acid hydroxylase superfamily)